ncbi:MAG: metal-sensitive transcriptional regulator [Planctomycetota bacterium]|nr:metal-sensitive transcriptional regulator [Planctomycetota bacterium]
MPRSTSKRKTSTNCEAYLSEEAVKELTNSLSRIEGHVGAVKRMIDERRCCDEILTQVAAVKAALNRVTIKLTETELLNCLTSCGQPEAEQRLASAMKAIGSMLKH